MKRNLQSGMIGALGGILVMALTAQAPMSIRPDGVQFTDGTVLTTADTRLEFYLTESAHHPTTAPGACIDGFHMASLFEINVPSNLRYAGERPEALTRDDSGQGPPSNVIGWVRTGYLSSGSNTPGIANCDGWASNDEADHGTLAQLAHIWDDSALEPPAVDWLGPWSTISRDCDNAAHVWCVEDSGPPPLL